MILWRGHGGFWRNTVMVMLEGETFVPVQTPTGRNYGEIVARLEEIEAEEEELSKETIKLMDEAES